MFDSLDGFYLFYERQCRRLFYQIFTLFTALSTEVALSAELFLVDNSSLTPNESAITVQLSEKKLTITIFFSFCYLRLSTKRLYF